jgi:AraC-like DNA-binding protein
MVSFDPSRPDFAPYGFTCVRWRPTRMRRPDHHNEIELNLLPRGWVTYLLGGRQVRVEAGRLHAFWAAIPHQVVDFGGGRDYFVATIPLAWFLQCRLPDRMVQPLLRGELLSDPTTSRGALDAALFAQWITDLRDPSAEMPRAALIEMEARLLRMAAALPAERDDPERRRRPVTGAGGLNRVERMACLIAQRYREKLTVDEIARAAGLHPNYAMGLFQRTLGATIVDCLTSHRVAHAQRLLATTDAKVVDVAFDSGFTSLSRFNEAFRQACACSPREYRRRHRLR